METKDVVGYLSRLDAESKTFRAVRDEIGQVIPAYLEAKTGLANLEKTRAGLEGDIARLTGEKLAAEQSTRATRREFDDMKTELLKRRAEHMSALAEFDNQVKARQDKLSALDAAIQEKAQTLGGLIAREVVNAAG